MLHRPGQTLSIQNCCEKVNEHISVKKAKALFYCSFGNAHAYTACYNSTQNKNPGWGLEDKNWLVPNKRWDNSWR